MKDWQETILVYWLELLPIKQEVLGLKLCADMDFEEQSPDLKT
jgi:hypothetical protein